MHILIVPSWYANSRNKVHGSFFKEQAKALQRAGFKVTVAYNEIWPLNLIKSNKEKRGIFSEVEDGLNTYRYKDYNYLPKNPLMFKLFNRRMEKLYDLVEKKEGKIDVIHAHSSMWAGISAAYVSKKKNTPLVITEHSSIRHSKYLRKSYLPLLLNSYKAANKMVVVGHGLKKEIQRHIPNKEIEVVNNLVDLELFNPKEREANKDFTFFSCAFLEAGKGMEDLILAFKELLNHYKSAKLKIGGDGTEKSMLMNLVKELGIEDKVEFLGALSREQVAQNMNHCDAFVLASHHETFGVVYIEALACGKPIIATKNGGAEDIVDEINGVISDVGDVSQLKKSLIYVLENINKFNSEIIRKYCINKFSEKSIIGKLEKIYEELV